MYNFSLLLEEALVAMNMLAVAVLEVIESLLVKHMKLYRVQLIP